MTNNEAIENAGQIIDYGDIDLWDNAVETKAIMGDEFKIIIKDGQIYILHSYCDSDCEDTLRKATELSEILPHLFANLMDKGLSRGEILTNLFLLGILKQAASFTDEVIYYVIFSGSDGEDFVPLSQLDDSDNGNLYDYDEALQAIMDVRSDFPSYYGFIIDASPVLKHIKGV